MMSNSPQMLGQRTRGGSLQSSREISAPGAQVNPMPPGANPNAYALQHLNPTAQQQIILRQQAQRLMANQAFLANNQGGGMPINRENERDPNPKKLHKEQQDREIYSNDFLRARSLQGGQGYPPSEFFGPFPPQYNTDGLLGRLWSTHYTISQDHTSGQEAHEDSLLASFGKRRRTDKPSIPLGGSILLQRSPTLLTRLADGNDAVAQNEGSFMDEVTEEDFDFFDNMDTMDLDAPKDAVSLPKETATTKPNEGKDRGDEVKFQWVRKKQRHRPVQPRPVKVGHLSQQYFSIDTSRVNKSGDRPPETLKRRCHSCNRGVSGGEWRRGPDGAGTLCNACGLHYAKLERKRG